MVLLFELVRVQGEGQGDNRRRGRKGREIMNTGTVSGG